MPNDHGKKNWKHAMADIHYVTAGGGERTMVLVHGFPQTWWQWRCVIPTLADAGFRVVAPDYRGAGDSQRTSAGYDKRTMAADLHRLLRHHLQVEGPIVCASFSE